MDQCRSGPPNLSESIHELNPGNPTSGSTLFNIDSESFFSGIVRNKLHVMVDNGAHNFICSGAGSNPLESIPYLSVGAVNGRGNAYNVAKFKTSATSGYYDRIRFNAQILGQSTIGCPTSTCPAGLSTCFCANGRVGAHAGVMTIAEWGGVPRMLYIDMYSEGILDNSASGPVHNHFNWPINDSIYWPGADLVLVDRAWLSSNCSSADPGALSTTLTQHTLNVRAAYSCLQGYFDSAPSSTAEVTVSQVHGFVETYGTSGYFHMAVDGITTLQSP